MKYIALFIIVLASHGVMGQGIFDGIINRITDSMTDSTGAGDEEFVHHDTTTNKLYLSVNAVCRVVLVDGSTVEGFVDLSTGGHTNSFYFEDGESSDWKVKERFSIDFYFKGAIHQPDQTYSIFRDQGNGVVDTVHFKNVTRLYYLDWHGESRLGTDSKTTKEREDGGSRLTMSNTIKCETRWELKDSLAIFQELAPDSYIRHYAGLRSVKVKVSEIRSFELVTKPAKKWLDIINKNRTEADRVYLAAGKAGYAVKSNWYHIIHRDPMLIEYVQDCFDLVSEASGEFVLH